MGKFGRMLTILVALLLIMGCAAPQQGTGDTTHGGMDHANMANTLDGDAFDLQFIDGMIVHHEGAIAMAQELLQKGEHEELLALGEEIIAAQATEVTQLKEWRDAWFPGAAQTPTEQMEMGEMTVVVGEGKSYDQSFMEAMVSHHEGALAMAQAALEKSGRSELREFAQRVIDAQTSEIEQMQAWMDAWQ